MKVRVVERVNQYCSRLRRFEIQQRRFFIWWPVTDCDTAEEATAFAHEYVARRFHGRAAIVERWTWND